MKKRIRKEDTHQRVPTVLKVHQFLESFQERAGKYSEWILGFFSLLAPFLPNHQSSWKHVLVMGLSRAYLLHFVDIFKRRRLFGFLFHQSGFGLEFRRLALVLEEASEHSALLGLVVSRRGRAPAPLSHLLVW